ncbi:lipopolysaccharide assembly protein LapB [Flavobacterium sp. H122]|uniref:tetratricopeptide repeat protein n=1 Tax=Flavobacterium sp. H122 TaxID=2529860 RepID=UPI00145B511E|nr:tetratricopeptide repeat protein [Flavobacterium sp. H122]
MKRKAPSLIILLLSFSCVEKESSSIINDGVDLILDRANNYSLPKSERLRLIKLAENKLNNYSVNDSLYRERLFKLAGRYYNIQDYENYLRVVKKVYNLSLNEKDNFAIAKGFHYIADYHYSKFRNDSAYYYFTKAEKKYDSLNHLKDLIRVKFSKADILLYEKDFSGAEAEIIKVLKIAKIVNDDRLIYDCYVNLGNALLGLNNEKEALIYYEKALNYTNNLEDDPQYITFKAQVLNYIGKVYTKIEVYETAKQYYNAAMDIADLKFFEPYLYSSIINNEAYAELKLGNFQQAEKMFFEALNIRKNQNNTPGIVGTYLNLGELYKAKGKKDKSIYYLNQARELANSNKIFEDELKSLKILTRLDGKNKSKLFERYIRLNDSLQNVERANRNKFARIEYETEEILNEKKLIQEEKEQISSQRWLILFSSGILILFLGLLYNSKVQYSKNRQLQFEKAQQESNEQIYKLMLRQQTIINDVRQQEKKRISQELHDGVMSKLTSTRLNLFVLTKKK